MKPRSADYFYVRARRYEMNTKKLLVLCVPTILVTLIFGSMPWGVTTAAISLALYGVVLFLPSKSLVRVNANVALEGLTYGDIKRAKDHIEIALREAEASTKLSAEDIELLQSACDKVASALMKSGQIDAGNSLRKHGETIASRLSPNT